MEESEITFTPTSTSNIGMSIVSPATPYTPSRDDLPLTTPFEYAPNCLDRWLVTRFGSRSYLYSTSPRGSTTDPFWTSCEPLKYQTVYSPGICPEGKELAAVTESRWDAVTEWRGICCPRGFYLVGSRCIGKNTTPVRAFLPFTLTDYTTRLSGSSIPSSTYLDYFPSAQAGRSTSSSTTTLAAGQDCRAQTMAVLWQSSDLSKFPQEYATSLAKKVGIDYTATPGSTAGPPDETSTTSQGLTTGAKAGIGVGAGLFALIFIALIAFLALRRHRRNRESAPAASNLHRDGLGEMEDQDIDHATRRWYLDGTWRSEADSKDQPEQPGPRDIRVIEGPPRELDGLSNVHR